MNSIRTFRKPIEIQKKDGRRELGVERIMSIDDALSKIVPLLEVDCMSSKNAHRAT